MKSSELKEKPISLNNLFLICCSFAFLFFYFLLSFHNRAASDDIYSIVQFKELGAIDLLVKYYVNWSGRWPTILYFSALLNFSDPLVYFHKSIFIYHLVTLLILFLSVNSIFAKLSKIALRFEPSKLESFAFNTLFIASVYFFTFESTEVWWWICSSFVYLQGLVALLAGIALVLNKKNNFLNSLFIVICFAYLGGSSEVYVISVIAISISILAFLRFHQQGVFQAFINGSYFKSFCLASVSFLLSAMISFSAPGNRMRNDFSMEKKVSASSEVGARPSQTVFGFVKKYPFALGICLFSFILARRVKEHNPGSDFFKQPANTVLLSALPVLISLILTWSFQKLFLKEPIPARAWTFSSFLLTVFFWFLFFVLGYKIKLKEQSARILSILIPSFVLTLLILNIFNQYKITSNYAEHYDQLITELNVKVNKGEKDTLFVKPLPDPGMLVALYPEDKNISEGLEQIMQLPFKISVESSK